ncbi:MAG: beta-galactosidase [Anaerocolumna sp.]|jgi:hypothetical protein|nr:beta-galactosidase [Anaerocolumna sp.]
MMTEFGYTKDYMTKDNKPWFPIMGEIHYSRYPKEFWKESLYKMKAGGIDVVSSYTIWIHHEEIEGEYDFTGNKDLRSFAETCKECGLYFMLRIGPWSHAEVRNGGFPDWLLKKDFEPRSNDPKYFDVVKKYYTEIFKQVEGLLHKDGGPIIGIQIENEYGHCGGLDGEDGEQHMRTLYELAKEIGFDVPIYTATGWGGAVTGGLLPVMGGYCEAPWDQRLTDIEPSGNYIFTHERNDHNIGSDYGFGTGITFDLEKFPYLTAELGGGLQVTHHRRPVATAEDIGAMSLVKLGSGVNLLGYYMYHGGTNPKGKLTTLQESRATGYLNDLPELSYDFRAPIREYGQISETAKEIKLLSMFLKEYGSELCNMPAYIPQSNPLVPTNLSDIRTSYRHNGNSGYVFVNNYQRRYPMEAHEEVTLEVELSNETITFPEINIEDKAYFFYPFNMQLGSALLKSATVTPLCTIKNLETAYVFYGDEDPNYDIEIFAGSSVNFIFAEEGWEKSANEDFSGKVINIVTLSREDAKNAWKVNLENEYLFISDSSVIETDKGIQFIGRTPAKFKVFPELLTTPKGFTRVENEGDFAVYKKEADNNSVDVTYQLLETSEDKQVYEIDIKYQSKELADCFLSLSYEGDSAKIYHAGEFIADNFYTGENWEIGLKRFNFPDKLTLEVYALHEKAEVFLEKWPTMKNGVACELTDVKAEIEYVTVLG